jgi:hypothetical protein
MFPSLSTLRKSVASMLPVCLLCLHFGCVAICSHHLDDLLKAGAHGLTVCDTDENCPITPAVTSVLPERTFLSSVIGDPTPLIAPIHSLEFAYDRSLYQLESFLSPSPPSERLCVLRI